MKNGEPATMTGGPAGAPGASTGTTKASTGRAGAPKGKAATPSTGKSDAKKRFGAKAKTPAPAPRQPRARQRLSVTVLGTPDAAGPLFEDPLLTDLEAGRERTDGETATSVLEVPLDLSWPPPAPADDASGADTDPLHLRWPSPASDAGSPEGTKSKSGWTTPALDDTAAILEAQLDLSWPAPATSQSDAPDAEGEDALPEVDVWPDVQQIDIPFELRLPPPTPSASPAPVAVDPSPSAELHAIAPPALEIPVDLSPTPPVAKPALESAAITEVALDLSPTPPVPTVGRPRPARARAATPPASPGETALDAPVAPSTAPTPAQARTKATPARSATPPPTPAPAAKRPVAATRPASAPLAPDVAQVAEPVARVVEARVIQPGNTTTAKPTPRSTEAALPQARKGARTRPAPRPASKVKPATAATSQLLQSEPDGAPTPEQRTQPAKTPSPAPPTPAAATRAVATRTPRPAATAPALVADAPQARPDVVIPSVGAPADATASVPVIDAPETPLVVATPEAVLVVETPTAGETPQAVVPVAEPGGPADAVDVVAPAAAAVPTDTGAGDAIAPSDPAPTPRKRAARRTPAITKRTAQPEKPRQASVADATWSEPATSEPTPIPAAPRAAVGATPAPGDLAPAATSPVDSDATNNPVDAPGWPMFGEFSRAGATTESWSTSTPTTQAPAPVDDGFRPYRAVYERNASREDEDGDGRASAAESAREAAWERAAIGASEPDEPSRTDADASRLGVRFLSAGISERVDSIAGKDTAPDDPQDAVSATEEISLEEIVGSVDDAEPLLVRGDDWLEARLEVAERELRRLEKRTNRQNGDLRNARRREIADAVRIVLEDGELTPHFDLLMGNGRFEFHRRGPGLSNTPGTIRRLSAGDEADQAAVADAPGPARGSDSTIRRDQ